MNLRKYKQKHKWAAKRKATFYDKESALLQQEKLESRDTSRVSPLIPLRGKAATKDRHRSKHRINRTEPHRWIENGILFDRTYTQSEGISRKLNELGFGWSESRKCWFLPKEN